MVHLRMQPEDYAYGAAIYTFELQSLIASSSLQFLLLRCCEILLFCRLDSTLMLTGFKEGLGHDDGEEVRR